LGKLVDLSLSPTKKIANQKVLSFLIELLSATDSLPIRGEYKLWIHRNYIILLLRFHLCEDTIINYTIKNLNLQLAKCYLKRWLQLPRNAIWVILYYPGVCCPNFPMYLGRQITLMCSCFSQF